MGRVSSDKENNNETENLILVGHNFSRQRLQMKQNSLEHIWSLWIPITTNIF